MTRGLTDRPAGTQHWWRINACFYYTLCPAEEVMKELHIWLATGVTLTCTVHLKGAFSYNRIDSIKSPASGVGNFCETMLMSQVGKVREVVCSCSQCCGGASIRLLTLHLLSCEWGRRAVMFVRFALKVVTQNGEELTDVILLYRVAYTTVLTITDKNPH